jgi:DNA-binding response OmpR family regulator
MHKILVVDDDADILTLVKLTLNINGFEVEALSRWEHIDSTINNYNPDLILLDVSLGDADGREICKRLKLSAATSHIPVILFSANVEMEKSIKDCHAQAFISKPYSLTQLLQVIQANIDESKTSQFAAD